MYGNNIAYFIENLTAWFSSTHLVVLLVMVAGFAALMTVIINFHIRKYGMKDFKIQTTQLTFFTGLGVLILLALVFLSLSLR